MTQNNYEYPIFGPDDDDFHDHVLSDRWWETETNWFSWCVPERKLSGWTYCQARPNASICNGGAWVWDDSSPFEWGLPYHANYSGLQLPPRSERDMRDFEWPNGVHTKTLEPLKKYQIRYSDPGAFELDIVFDAIMPPNPHPIGVAPFYKGVHFDQAGRVTGSMILHGESIAIDCFAVRDRSWGPRPQGRPKKRKSTDHDQLSGTGGIGYSYGTLNEREAFLVYTVPTLDSDQVVTGFLIRDGVYSHIIGGERKVAVDPEHGWVRTIDVEAHDDLGRTIKAHGEAQSWFFKGNPGDCQMWWWWDGVDRAVGEDQSYVSKRVREKWISDARAARG